MAASLTFTADFSNFSQALDRATLKLKDFAVKPADVEKALNRMGDAFSGKKIIADATLAAKAIESMGGVSKLTANEQARLNSIVTEALAKYAAVGKQAPQNLLDIEKATRKVEESTKGLSTRMVALGATIGTALGNIATDALRSMGSALVQAAKDGQKFSQLTPAFDKLTASIGSTRDAMLSTTRTATKGLISDLDLMQSVNKAVLLGLPVTTNEMGDLAKAATTLGRAMGKDAASSVDDLITALGRSSPQILDNLGLTVKVGEANEKYAASLGRTAESLTDAERKTAFYNAAMEAARIKTATLGDQALTASEQIDRLLTSLGNIVTRLAAIVNESKATGGFLGMIADSAEKAATKLNDLITASDRLKRSLGDLLTSPLGAIQLLKELGTISGEQVLATIPRPPIFPAAPTELSVAEVVPNAASSLKTVKGLTEETDKLVTNAEKAAEKVAAMWKSTKAFLSEANNTEGLKRMNQDLEVFQSSSTKATRGLQGMATAAPMLIRSLDEGEPVLVAWSTIVEKQPLDLKKWENALYALPPAIKDIGDELDRTQKKTPGFLSGLTGGFKDVWKGMSGGEGIGGMLSKIGTGISEGFGNLISGGITKLIDMGFSAILKGVSGLFGKILKSEGKKVNDLRDAAFDAAGGFDKLNEKAALAGTSLERVLSTKKVKDYEAAWKDLQGTLAEYEADQERLQAAIDKYGFTIEQLGPTLQKQELDKQAKELIEDWRVLVAAGIDMATVNEKMAKTIGEYFQTALRVGAEIPAAMRPILQAMVDQGTLVDANGEKITDLETAGVKFSETMTEGFDRVVKKLDELIDRLQGAGKAISDIPSTVGVDVQYRDPGPPSWDASADAMPAFAGGTRGRFLDFQSGTPVLLHGRERVMTEAEGRAEGGALDSVASALEGIDRRISAAVSRAVTDALILAPGWR